MWKVKDEGAFIVAHLFRHNNLKFVTARYIYIGIHGCFPFLGLSLTDVVTFISNSVFMCSDEMFLIC